MIEKKDIEIRSKWGTWDTTLLTSKLYRHVKKGEIEFELTAKKGSVDVIIVIGVISGLIAITDFSYRIGQYLRNRIAKRKKKGVHLTPVIIINRVDKIEINVTGEDEEIFDFRDRFYKRKL